MKNGLPALGHRVHSSQSGYLPSFPTNAPASCTIGTFGEMAMDDIIFTDFIAKFWANVGNKLSKDQSDYTIDGVANEHGVGAYIAELLRDVAEGLGLDFKILGEVQIEGIRPDYIITFKLDGVVGAVEIKLPKSEDDNSIGVTDSHILGEVFDQLLHLKTVYRVATPFIILTTYKHWRVCWLDNDESKQVAKAVPVMPMSEEVMPTDEEGKENRSHHSTPAKTKSKTKRKSPPPNVSKSPSKGARVQATSEDTELHNVDEEDVKRLMCATEPVAYNDPRVMQMIVSYMVKIAGVKRDVVHYMTGGVSMYVGIVGPKKVQWKRITLPNGGLQFQSYVGDSKTIKNFYLWEDLGTGAFGQAFLVSGGSTHAVGVLKLLKKREHEDKAERNSRVDEEKNSWLTVYDNKFNVTTVDITGESGLLMPWFQTIPVRDRYSRLDDIKACLLENFASRGLKHPDVRWRNVAIDATSGNVVMIDLGGLQNVSPGKEPAPVWVTRAIETLTKSVEGELA